MLPITKLPEPQVLLDYKAISEILTYDDFKNYNTHLYDKKEDTAFFKLRAQLLKEQKYVCAYCGQELLVVLNENGKQQMKTEHFKPQNKTLEIDLDYQNLLGCCLGGDDKKGIGHCDSKKAHSLLSHIQNPSQIAVRDITINYDVREAQREVKIFSSDTDKNNELLDRLNLNHKDLRENRFRIWEKVIKRQLGDEDTWTIHNVQKVCTDYSNVSNGQHKQFKDFVLWYLNNWLSKNHR